MKCFIKIKNCKWIEPGKSMLYEDEHGDFFIGPPIENVNKDTIIIEAGEKQTDGYYPIIRVLGRV